MSILRKTVFTFIFTFSYAQAEQLNKLAIYTEEYPPYNMMIKGEKKGIAVDLLERVLNNLGSKLNRDNFRFQPWARGYRLTQSNNNTMLFSTTRTAQREELFKWVGPIYKARVGLIAKKDSNIKINSIEEIQGYNIGAVLDDVAEQLLYSKKVRKNTIDSISGNNVIEQSFRKLKHNRIDLFSYNTDVAFYSLSEEDKKKFKVVYILDELELYFAFNKQTDDKLISLLQEELDRIKKTPVYKEILQRYIQ